MSNNNNTNDYNQREGRVLELYDQGKNTREIAKELRMSLRDISFILKKGQVNHGIVSIMDNGNKHNNKPANGKATRLTNSLAKERSL
jgi:DNA-binding NarL/FixJ family response regulator